MYTSIIMKIVNINVFVYFRPLSKSTESLEYEYSKTVLESSITEDNKALRLNTNIFKETLIFMVM